MVADSFGASVNGRAPQGAGLDVHPPQTWQRTARYLTEVVLQPTVVARGTLPMHGFATFCDRFAFIEFHGDSCHACAPGTY